MTFDEIDMYSGLAALHWSAYDDPAWDHDFYKRVVEQAGGLALDVACGAGRLLRRYLAGRAGGRGRGQLRRYAGGVQTESRG